MEANKIKCPVCKQNNIWYEYYPSTTRDNTTTTVGGRRARTKTTTSAKEFIRNGKCSCGAKESQILKLLNKNKQPGNKEVLERLRQGGLPLRIKTTKQNNKEV